MGNLFDNGFPFYNKFFKNKFFYIPVGFLDSIDNIRGFRLGWVVNKPLDDGYQVDNLGLNCLGAGSCLRSGRVEECYSRCRRKCDG